MGGEAISQTRQEIRARWNKEHIQSYTLSLHKEYDKEYIEYVENEKKKGAKTSTIFKRGLDKLIHEE